jgi:hypothetical protein
MSTDVGRGRDVRWSHSASAFRMLLGLPTPALAVDPHGMVLLCNRAVWLSSCEFR